MVQTVSKRNIAFILQKHPALEEKFQKQESESASSHSGTIITAFEVKPRSLTTIVNSRKWGLEIPSAIVSAEKKCRGGFTGVQC